MQYVVVVFEDFTMVATAAGPFRSEKRAKAACDRINRVSAWTEMGDGPTAVAQVVFLEGADDIAARLKESDTESTDGTDGVGR